MLKRYHFGVHAFLLGSSIDCVIGAHVVQYQYLENVTAIDYYI